MPDHRPLSPHLDIYRWRITMLSSTLHRASGAFICLGLVLFSIWLAVAAFAGHLYQFGPLGGVFWFLWTLALFYHLFNGIRHLSLDMGKGFSLQKAQSSARQVIIAAVALNIITWIILL